jgi:hypothetical protein
MQLPRARPALPLCWFHKPERGEDLHLSDPAAIHFTVKLNLKLQLLHPERQSCR